MNNGYTAHRPVDPAALALEAYRLARTHKLKPYDIAMCLGVTVETVREWLGEEVQA